jgi:uncharacterized protein DUF222
MWHVDVRSAREGPHGAGIADPAGDFERAAEAEDSAVGLEFGTLPADVVRDDGSAPSAPNGWYAQQADALVAIAKGYLRGGPAGDTTSTSCDRYQVIVHTDSSALHGGAGRSDLPIDTVKRLACDGSVITIVEDEEGTPLDVGRKTRTISTVLRRALLARDRHCTFPGCHNRCYVDGHHIEHWADGGETNLANLTLLCTFHHTLVHEGGFKICSDGAGASYFRRPDGRVIPRFGYRLDDLRDEHVADDNPSMEVREPMMV